MANEIAKELAEITTIAATPTAHLTLASGKRDLITSMHLFNAHTGAVIVQIYRVPSGDTPVAANQIEEVTLASKEPWQWEGLRVLDTTGDSIRAEADVAGVVTFEIDGVEEDQ